MINQKWLHTFMDLVKTGHFTKTANNLYMTQPGVSQHIKKLETELNTKLLNRYDKQFELTRAGQLLYEYGQASLVLDEKLQSQLDFDDPYQGPCYIACSGAIAYDLYSDFIDYQSVHSGLRVDLEAAPNHSIIEAVLTSAIHIGIISQKVQHSQLIQKQLGNEPLLLILPCNYSDKKITLESLNELGFINHPDGFEFVDKALTANKIDGYTDSQSLTISGYVNQLNQILLPVSKGIGYTVLPERAVAQFSHSSQLYVVPMKVAVSEPLYIITKKHYSLPSRYDWFLDKIAQRLG